MKPSYFSILDAGGLSPQTRRVLKSRMAGAGGPLKFFTEEELAVVDALAEAVLPQGVVGTRVPFGRSIDERLSSGEGLGWRYAELPPDGEAYRRVLGMVGKDVGYFLGRVAAGELDTVEFPVSRWLEGFKVELTRMWLASPETMDLMGYRGAADDGLRPQVDGVIV